MSDRFDRQIRLFGEDGQRLIQETRVAVVGLGGTGSHLVQQLGYLGVQDYALIEKDPLDSTSMNRVVTALPKDVEEKRPKIDVAEEMLHRLCDKARIRRFEDGFFTQQAFRAIQECDFVFGCVDRDSVRFALTDLCHAYEVPYLDIATDVDRNDPSRFGGRMVLCNSADGCLVCREELDHDAVAREFETDVQANARGDIYGVPVEFLDERGPSVVSLNGVLASLAVTEFMVAITGLRPPTHHLVYDGRTGGVRTVAPPGGDCFFCKSVRGQAGRRSFSQYLQADATA